MVVALLLAGTIRLRGADAPEPGKSDAASPSHSLAMFKAKLRNTLTQHVDKLLGAEGSVHAMKGKTIEGNAALAFYLMFEVSGEQRYRRAALSLEDQVLKDMCATKFGVLPLKEKDKPGGTTIVGGGPPALGAYT